MNYNHTQIGKLPTILLGLFFIIFLIISIFSGDYLLLGIIFFILGLCFSLFYCLNVSVNDLSINIKFGIGLIKKSFLFSEIKSVKQVKNKWCYGWGIRFWFWPKMIIFNVSGYDAVEIVMLDNRIFRIGTDDVKNLYDILSDKIK